MLSSGKSRPELISLHIPKTAGTSFRNILKSVYGENQVVRFDIDGNGVPMMNELRYHNKKLPEVKVIHGHFIYEELIRRYPLPEACKLITWVRDPVKRVISNFYYLESRLKEIINEEQKNLNILSKLQRTLIEYARAELNRNRQTKFLAGSTPDRYDFIGIQEYFEQEIIRLSVVLDWKEIPAVLYHNKTPKEETLLPVEVIDEIRELNLEDVQLYAEALQIRKNKMSK